MIIIFVFSKNQKSRYNKNIQKFASNAIYFTFFIFSFECVSARNRNFTRSLYLSFENGCSTLEVVSLDRRYARYDAESIGAKVSAWWKSRKSIKGIEKNWEGFTVSGTRFTSPLATTSSIAWLEPLALWQTTSFARSTILCYKRIFID